MPPYHISHPLVDARAHLPLPPQLQAHRWGCWATRQPSRKCPAAPVACKRRRLGSNARRACPRPRSAASSQQHRGSEQRASNAVALSCAHTTRASRVACEVEEVLRASRTRAVADMHIQTTLTAALSLALRFIPGRSPCQCYRACAWRHALVQQRSATLPEIWCEPHHHHPGIRRGSSTSRVSADWSPSERELERERTSNVSIRACRPAQFVSPLLAGPFFCREVTLVCALPCPLGHLPVCAPASSAANAIAVFGFSILVRLLARWACIA